VKVQRKILIDSFFNNYCPKCEKIVKMEVVHTGLPGIQAKNCNECSSHYMVNLLESDEDLLDIPDDLKFKLK